MHSTFANITNHVELKRNSPLTLILILLYLPNHKQLKFYKKNHEVKIKYLVFIYVFSFLSLNLDSMQVLSHTCFFLPNFLGHVMHFRILD
jgi:hypothetical protein